MADLQSLALDLLSALRKLPAIRLLPSKTGHGTLRNDLLRLISAAISDDFDLFRIIPLLKSAITNAADDALIWKEVYSAVFEKYKEGSEPLFRVGWSGFPEEANQDHDLSWAWELSGKLARFGDDCFGV